MGARDLKIGYKTDGEGNSTQNRRTSTISWAENQYPTKSKNGVRKNTSVVSKSIGNTENYADLIEPFPPPSIEQYTPASSSQTEPSPSLSPLPDRRNNPLFKESKASFATAHYHKMVLNAAQVKSVLSGDCLVLTSPKNPSLERILSLAYCQSPHMKREGDDPWAFQCRDALRKLIVGKAVQFQVLYSIPNTKREYGIVFLNDGRRLPEVMIEEGWLKLREDAGRKEDTEEALQQLDKLRLLEATARSEDRGLWSPNIPKMEVHHDMGDPQAFLDTWKGNTVNGLVERVLSGDRMLVRLLITPEVHYQGNILFQEEHSLFLLAFRLL
jgi:staphylococcal nuclease domain-containing protein 1